jgi:uncharacterized SAM-binding protein YcdF (DUF218 family)
MSKGVVLLDSGFIDNSRSARLILVPAKFFTRKGLFRMRKISRLFALTIILGLLSVPITAVASYDDDDQPHMQAALEALQQAKHHLEEAKHDKGGHRVAAIKSIDAAINHVKEGMEAGEKHEHHK